MTKLSPEAADYLSQFDARLLQTSEGRRILTRLHPRLFALVYMQKHLHGQETDEVISFSEAQLDWYSQMQEWVKPVSEPKEWRRAYVSPRASAKSTTWFLIAPMWAAAHGHTKFVAAFADAAMQAEGHLSTFKTELQTNELLRRDYPDLCTPLRRSRGAAVADSASMMHMKNGFVFAARGIDAASLGLKVGERRPDLLILDDVEPSESNYSAYQAEKRLSTLTNAILPLNDYARTVLVGTVTMDGSLIHQLVETRTTSKEPSQWIKDENFETWYYPAILTNADGTERSLWPERWSLEFLQANRHTRSFALNFMNFPVAMDGAYWSQADITYLELPAYPRTIISVDPAVTTKTSSDNTGIAVISHDPLTKKVYVRECIKVKLDPASLRKKIAALLNVYPETVVLLVETNQGGDMWAPVFKELPVKYHEVKQSVKKETRATWLLNAYQRREVVHTKPLTDLETELLAFPRGLHDDLVDAVGSGANFFLGFDKVKKTVIKPGAKVASYT